MFKAPEYFSGEDFKNRLVKSVFMRETGLNPYPNDYQVSHDISYINRNLSYIDVSSKSAEDGNSFRVKSAGRLVLFRAMGKNAFGQIRQGKDQIQVMFNKHNTALYNYDKNLNHIRFIEKKIDLGDILGVEGHLFKTKKGQLTIYAKMVTVLSKSLLPLPDKHSGIQNKEIIYRKRWLDLISNDSSVNNFIIRSEIIKIIRNEFINANFLEVETPILQNIYGGAEAKPFKTVFNALGKQDMFLRIALEISLKKLIIGGIDKVFEIGKVFRNEGIDRSHNPEFTMLEAYASYWDYNDMMTFTENLFENISKKILNTTKIKFKTKEDLYEIDLKTPWKRISMIDSIKEYGQIDIDSSSDQDLKDLLLNKFNYQIDDIKDFTRGTLIFKIFEETVEDKLIQPHHIIDHPIETTPFCKLHRDIKKAKVQIVERFESFIGGIEICNSYTELNDPILQRELLENQAKAKGEDFIDEDFVEAMSYGMPPTAGLGIGIDRVIMLFTNTNIKDIIFFPFLRTKS